MKIQIMVFPLILLLLVVCTIWVIYKKREYDILENILLSIPLGMSEDMVTHMIGLWHIRSFICSSVVHENYKRYEWTCLFSRERRLLRLAIYNGVVMEINIVNGYNIITKRNEAAIGKSFE